MNDSLIDNRLYNAEFYRANNLCASRSASVILPYVLNLVHPTSIIDFGCGTGTWLCVAKQNGIDSVLGLDGDYVDINSLSIEQNEFMVIDLSKDFSLNQKFDLAISLEVAEHIKKENADTFIQNIVNHSDMVLFSAAIPYQGGVNHYNENWPSYWVEKFASHGYKVCDCLRNIFWDNTSIDYWYRQNILFFYKNELKKPVDMTFQKNLPLDIVHPEQYYRTIHYMDNYLISIPYIINHLPKWLVNKVFKFR